MPFVLDAVIKILGPRHRAFSAALIEFCAVVATLVAALFVLAFGIKASIILGVIFFLFLGAAFLQKMAEKHKVFRI